METVAKNTLIGAVVGAIVSVGLYILGGSIEVFNLVCSILTCNCNSQYAIPGMWNDGAFLNMFLICSIGGAAIGFVYGLEQMKVASNAEKARLDAENLKAVKKQRQKWADEVKQKALSVANTCNSNAKNVGNLVQTNYKASTQMEAILKEFSNVSELKGKIDEMAEDVKKGGVN